MHGSFVYCKSEIFLKENNIGTPGNREFHSKSIFDSILFPTGQIMRKNNVLFYSLQPGNDK